MRPCAAARRARAGGTLARGGGSPASGASFTGLSGETRTTPRRRSARARRVGRSARGACGRRGAARRPGEGGCLDAAGDPGGAVGRILLPWVAEIGPPPRAMAEIRRVGRLDRAIPGELAPL